MAAQKSRVFHWKDQHFDFPLQFCYSKMHCFREYLQTTGKSVCLPHLIRLGCEAGAAAAALRGRRSWRTSCRSGCRNRETVRWRSTVLHWRGFNRWCSSIVVQYRIVFAWWMWVGRDHPVQCSSGGGLLSTNISLRFSRDGGATQC